MEASAETTLVFATDPLSTVALVTAAVGLGSLAFFAYSYVKAAGWKRGLLLSGLRTLLMSALGIVLLQPGLLRMSQVTWTLPDSFVHRTVRAMESQEFRPLLPPLSATPPPKLRLGGDVYMESVVLPPMAFLKSETHLLAEVVNEGDETTATMKVQRLRIDGNRDVLKKSVVLRPGRQQLALTVIPEELGYLGWRIALEGLAQDPDESNNDLTFALLVMRDSIRVLHLAGRPSWDVRFLRQFLTTLPGAELVSFYLMVEAKDFAPHGREELSLIPFPIDDIFLDELGTFDLVVLQNFPLGTYFLMKDKHLRRLVQYVQSGGALMLLGGDQAYQAGRLQDTPLAPLLPVDLKAAKGDGDYLAGSFELSLGAGGREHPATAGLMEEAGRDGAVPLPALVSLNPVGALLPGARELARAVAVLPGGTVERPLLVAGTPGKGRVLLVATDSTWKWAFPEKSEASSVKAYRALYRGAVDWLTRDPRAAEISVLAQESPALADVGVTLEVCSRGALEEKADEVRVEATWVDARGEQSSMTVQRSGTLAKGQCAEIALPPARPGVWFVKAALAGAQEGYSGETAVVVEAPRRTLQERLAEDIQPLLETPLMPLLAPISFNFHLPQASMVLEKPLLEPLWDHPAAFAVLAALLFFEWYLRRRWGYL